MWRDWQPEVVCGDLDQMAAEGIEVLRVFPLWPDFQPLQKAPIHGNGVGDMRMVEAGREYALPMTPAGRAGVSEGAMEKFRFLLDESEKRGLRLIVGLITGWMSGRLFAPIAFQNMDLITDPEVNRWQLRFVKHFVTQFQDHPALLAWDLGNECNCMQANVSHVQLGLDSLITNAIRSIDRSRKVISGMHSLGLAKGSTWHMEDQGE